MKKGFLYFIILLSFYSCRSKQYSGTYSKWNEFIFTNKELIKPQYQNDSLRLSMLLYGNYQNDSTCNLISGKEFARYKKLMAKYDIDMKPEHFVFKTSGGNSGMVLFSLPADQKTRDTVMTDTTSRSVILLKNINNKTAVGIFCNRYIELLDKSALGCIETLKSGKEYTKVIPKDPFHLLDSALAHGGYISALHGINSNNVRYSCHGWYYSLWLQTLMTFTSFAGDYKEVDELQKEFYGSWKKRSYQYHNAEAMDYLKSRLQDKQIVVMNEVHWQSRHRYLGNLLLDYLYGLGFRYLAMECIWENEDSLNVRKYPIQSTGYYSKDPVLGNLIRNALRMGFKLVSYDLAETNREYEQARKIYDKTLAKDSTAKVFVWSGGGHLNKSEKRRAMGFYLDSLAGGKMFAIVQHTPPYKLPSSSYFALSKDENQDFKYDLAVYNNYQPDHMKIIPFAPEIAYKFRFSPLVKKKITQHKELLLMIYNKNEFDSYGFRAIPVKNLLLRKQSPVTVNLPSGTYHYVIKSPYETVLHEEEMTIK